MAKNDPNELKQEQKCRKFHVDHFYIWKFFSYLQQKRRYDIISDTRYLRPHTWPVALNGLNRIFKIQFFLKSDISRTEIGRKVCFEQVFRKEVDFTLLFNPLRSKDFPKIAPKKGKNNLFSTKFQFFYLLEVFNFFLIKKTLHTHDDSPVRSVVYESKRCNSAAHT